MCPSPDETSTAKPSDYWSETRRPLNCLVFLAPLLVVYEIGVLWIRSDPEEVIRNGADYWMRSFLRLVGLNHAFLLPCLVVAGLLVWHIHAKYPWRISTETLAGMFAESLLFAFFLIVVGQLQDFVFQRWVFQRWNVPDTLSMSTLSMSTAAANFVSFIGAGVYEEVMFRLCLLPAAYGFFRVSKLNVRWSAILAVLSTSLFFSLAHYIGPLADSFSLFTFLFRILAGVFFAALFVLRGFGITVGCHAAYDLIVGLLLSASE